MTQITFDGDMWAIMNYIKSLMVSPKSRSQILIEDFLVEILFYN